MTVDQELRKSWNPNTLWVTKDTIPCGKAFGYLPNRKEIVEVHIMGYLSEVLRHTPREEHRAQLCAVIDGTPFPKPKYRKKKETYIQKILAYKCDQYYVGDSDFRNFGCWPVENIFSTLEEAKKETAFTDVQLSYSVYRKALGIDEKGRRIEEGEDSTYESDLPVCCGNCSEVRDQLIICMKRKGLEQWRIDKIKDYLQSSHPEFLEEKPSLNYCWNNLAQILKALKII